MKTTDEIMEKVQEFASFWALVGHRFDSGELLDRSEGLRVEICEFINGLQSECDTIKRKLYGSAEK